MISIGTKSRYAARIIAFIALHSSGTIVRRKAIAEAEAISIDYVEQILIKLKAAGFIRSHRGPKGGYSLVLPPEKITMADIVRSMEGSMELVPCQGSNCSRRQRCLTRPVWHRAMQALMDVLEGESIADIIANQDDDECELPTYSI